MEFIEIEKLQLFLTKIETKKKNLEKIYFTVIDIFNRILKSYPHHTLVIEKVTNKKVKFDYLMNHTILLLETVASKVKKNIVEASDFLKKAQSEKEQKRFKPLDQKEQQRYDTLLDEMITTPISPKKIEVFDELSDFSEKNKSKVNRDFEGENKDAMFAINEAMARNQPKKAILEEDKSLELLNKINQISDRLDLKFDVFNTKLNFLEDQSDNLNQQLLDMQLKASENKYVDQKPAVNQDPNLLNATSNFLDKIENFSSKISYVSKFLSLEQIENLEKLSIPLIKSLEDSLLRLTNDLNILKNENQSYKIQIENYKVALEKINKEKYNTDLELDKSTKSLYETVKKLNNLEEILSEQSAEINSLNVNRNEIITHLENKIKDTSVFLNQLLHEKETLIKEKNDLLQKINEMNLEQEKNSSNIIDEYTSAISIQDILQKEAVQIMDSKVNELIKRFQTEINGIKASIEQQRATEALDLKTSIFVDDFLSAEHTTIEAFLSDKLKVFEKKIGEIEQKIQKENQLKNDTEKAISSLSKLLENAPYTMIENEKNFLTNKFNQLEDKIESSLEKVKTNQDHKKEFDIDAVLDENKLNTLFLTSHLYGDIQKVIAQKDDEIKYLKKENQEIISDNQVMTNLLQQSMFNIKKNSNKLQEIEELLVLQEHDFMLLNDEKNSVINALIQTIKDRNLDFLDDHLGSLKIFEKYDFSDFAKNTLKQKISPQELQNYIEGEVAKIVKKEIGAMNEKYQQEIQNINHKYDSLSLATSSSLIANPKTNTPFLEEQNAVDQINHDQKIIKAHETANVVRMIDDQNALEKLVLKNQELEKKINDLEKLLNTKTAQFEYSSSLLPPKSFLEDTISDEEKNIKSQIDFSLNQSIGQYVEPKKPINISEIDQNVEKSIKDMHKTDLNWNVTDKIINSTKLLMKLQNELLNLENEITTEEFKVISNM